MHQNRKKTLAVLLALCMILAFIPVGTQAAVLQGEDYITQQLSLGEDLVLHLRASLPDEYADLAATATGTVTYAGKTDTYQMGDLVPDENGVYDLPVEMAVAEMTENINVVLKGTYMGLPVEAINENYSIRDYLVTIIEGDYSQTTKDLCLELLNMGAWAQLYFNHNISDLANAGYSISAANPVPEESPTVQRNGQVDGISFYGTSVRFLSKTAVRFYFEADGAVDGYTFTIDGTEYEPVAKDGYYYIETPGINPQNMSKEITASVTDGTDTLSVGYAPIWYFIRTYNKTEDEYNKGLMEAAYSYYKTAETYTTKICMDVEISTLSGSYESIGLGFYPLDFEGDINNYVDRIEIPTGTAYTVKLDQGKYLVDGEFLGIGVTVLGGPAWDSTLSDGSADRHNIKISDLRLEGPEDRPVDLTFATIASGTEGTGYTNANAGGTAALADGIITITGGFFTDGYKITFNEVDTYLKLDMEISTLSGNYESIGIGFYPYNFEGDINDYTDRIDVPAGSYTVKLDVSKYLVDGELPGIGFAVLGGPAWDTTLEDGTYDRHSINISNIRLEGELDQSIDLSSASVASGTEGTGYTNANAGGTATLEEGIISISGGFFTDGYKVTFVDETIPEETEPEATEPEATEPEATEPPVVEADTYICLDMLITTSSNSTDSIGVRFYPYNYEGSVHSSYTDEVTVTAGTVANIKLDLSKYLVDGELPGIGFAIMGGPEWNTQISDGVYDRHTVTVSNVHLEGEQSAVYDLSKSVCATGQSGTGYTDANGSGQATIGDSIVISGGYRYDGHKITLVEDSCTDIYVDLLVTTLGNSTDPIEVGFFPNNFEGDINNWTDKITVTAGTATTVKLDLDDYLVDGELPGIGFAIFGGPEWNTQLEDGTHDRHSITISGIRLEGNQSATYDLSQSVWTGGASSGYTNANSGGVGSIVNGNVVITGGFRYDGHKITLVKAPSTYLCLDMLITTLSNSTDTVGVRFYSYNYEGSVHSSYTDEVTVTAGTVANIKLDLSKYLVDGELPGIGFAIMGGPEWNTEISDGVYDRHTVTVSNVHLEGEQSTVYDLSKSVCATGQSGTGYTDANGSGQAAIGDSIVISGGYRYDGHKITLVEDTNTYICMDMLITTLGNSTDPIEVRFFPYNYAGSVGDGYTDMVNITAGTATTVKLNVENYLIDGELTGIGFAIMGGPAWDAKLEDGYTSDRHTVTISNARLEGYQSKAFDLSKSEWTSGTNAGYSWANGNGTATVGDSIVITNGFQYDGHKITLVEDTNTYICMDVLFTTLSNSTDEVEVRMYASDYTDSIHNGYTDKITVTAGTTTTVRLKVDEYLVDGELSGIGIGIFGGPQWNTQMEDGTYDRHSINISNIRLEGAEERTIDLSNATVSNDLPGSNVSGMISIVDGVVVVTDGFCYNGYKIVF